MRNAEEWLSQGDVFRELPIVEAFAEDGEVFPRMEWGPAMLCTHGCEIDKKTGSGESTVRLLNFVPLRSVVGLDESKQNSVRSAEGRINPSRSFFLGQITDLGELFCDLGQIYSLPATLFKPRLAEFPEGEGTTLSLVPTDHDTRLGTLRPDQLDLLQTKMNAFWTRRIPE